jgi:DNA repair protein RecO (recombination protein O)
MQKYTAIILSSYDIGEFDRIYIFYTKESGLMKAIGRGVRKQAAKLAGHLEPGTLSEVYVARSRGMGQIASAIALQNFENIKNDFEKLAEVLKIFKFFARHFSEEEKDERIFDLLVEFLSFLNRRSPTPPQSSPQAGEEVLIVEAFWWKLFDALGNRPETMKCAKCGARLEENEKKFFSVSRGGIVCEKCFFGEENIAKISSDQIKLLRIFLSNPLEKILKVKSGESDLKGLSKIRGDFERYNF